MTGESVSSVLSPGTYYVTIVDNTSYAGYSREEILREAHLPKIPVNIKLKPWNTANIEGKISIEGSEKVMPVSMRVAKFIGNDRVTDYSQVPKLNPALPVWVVVHGMNSNEGEVKIKELTKALSQHPLMKTAQIVTIDWNEAAVSLSGTGTDAPWTKAVGSWIANQLLAAGFRPDQINGLGHSHGTYALHAMGEKLELMSDGKQMNTLIALDPAGNPFWTGFDHAAINFADVSTRSAAFEIAWIADSNKLAKTADVSFKLNAPTEWKPWVEHGLGMTFFTQQLQEDSRGGGAFSNFVGLNTIAHLTDKSIRETYELDKYGEMAEAYIDVGVEWEKIDGKDYPSTSARRFLRYNPKTGLEESLFPDDTEQ